MKTPRLILLEQNRAHDLHLANIQRDIIADSLQPSAQRFGLRSRPVGTALGLACQKLWSELILPARRIWLSYAFIWLAIATFYIVTADHTVPRSAKIANPSEAVANWKEQQIVLVELLKPTTIEPADRPKTQQMRPRSEANHIAVG